MTNKKTKIELFNLEKEFLFEFENELFEGHLPHVAFHNLKLKYLDLDDLDFNHIEVQKKITELKDYLIQTYGSNIENIEDQHKLATNYHEIYSDFTAITRKAQLLNIDDPTVVKLGIIDSALSETCKQLWHNPINLYIPRPYKLSQLVKGAMIDFIQPYPSLAPTHINCRHMLSMVSPGFSFNEKGHPIYVNKQFDYYNFYYHQLIQFNEYKLNTL